jgi:hypothetical protein
MALVRAYLGACGCWSVLVFCLVSRPTCNNGALRWFMVRRGSTVRLNERLWSADPGEPLAKLLKLLAELGELLAQERHQVNITP